MNSNSPLVSIIVNCHNGQEYLYECLKSITKQTYENWELIFWDNHSSDLSSKILKSFKDKRIKYFKSNKFTSLYLARNLAIKKAGGKYITFLDTDDIWKKNKLSIQINFFKKNRDFKVVYSKYIVKKNRNYFNMHKKKLSSGFITQKLLDNYTIGILTVMLEKSIFEKKNFNKKFNIIGDFDFFIKISIFYKIACINKPLAIYRVHDENYSLKNLEQYITELSYWIKKNKNKLKKKNFILLSQYILLFKLKIKFILNKILGRVVQW